MSMPIELSLSDLEALAGRLRPFDTTRLREVREWVEEIGAQILQIQDTTKGALNLHETLYSATFESSDSDEKDLFYHSKHIETYQHTLGTLEGYRQRLEQIVQRVQRRYGSITPLPPSPPKKTTFRCEGSSKTRIP